MIADLIKTRREKKAAAWFTLLNDTEVENEDLEKFDKWIQRAGNRDAYRRIEDISGAATALRDDPEMVAAARQALSRPRMSAVKAAKAERATPRIWGGLAVAGVLASGLLLWLVQPPKTYRTDVGGRAVAHLDDGSTVQLNTDTVLQVNYRRGERRVSLIKGQAFFDVAHDPARPFLVSSGTMEVRAIGTRFDVRHDGPAAVVALAQGRVEVRQEDAQRGTWTLSPGQALVLRPGATKASPIGVDVAGLTSWTRNEVTFDDVALVDAVAEMNRYERSKITLAPGVPTQARISGVFATGEDQEFVAAAVSSFDLQSHRRADGGTELRPRSGG